MTRVIDIDWVEKAVSYHPFTEIGRKKYATANEGPSEGIKKLTEEAKSDKSYQKRLREAGAGISDPGKSSEERKADVSRAETSLSEAKQRREKASSTTRNEKGRFGKRQAPAAHEAEVARKERRLSSAISARDTANDVAEIEAGAAEDMKRATSKSMNINDALIKGYISDIIAKGGIGDAADRADVVRQHERSKHAESVSRTASPTASAPSSGRDVDRHEDDPGMRAEATKKPHKQDWTPTPEEDAKFKEMIDRNFKERMSRLAQRKAD